MHLHYLEVVVSNVQRTLDQSLFLYMYYILFLYINISKYIFAQCFECPAEQQLKRHVVVVTWKSCNFSSVCMNIKPKVFSLWHHFEILINITIFFRISESNIFFQLNVSLVTFLKQQPAFHRISHFVSSIVFSVGKLWSN